MQRVLVILTVIVVVAVSLGVGALASHWPFWRRAWQWQVAADGWPAELHGPVRVIKGGGRARSLVFGADAALDAIAATAVTQVLVHARGDRAAAFFAPGFEPGTPIDGRGLTPVLLVPLVALLREQHPGLLDTSVGNFLEEWRRDGRGAITPRQLLWQLSGLPAGTFRPLQPFAARAALASGPDFERAALRWRPTWPPGSHFEESPVNAQLLALVLATAGGSAHADLLERLLWSRIAGADAEALLDHRRGQIAAHCCLRAAVADWLRVALLLAEDGRGPDGLLWKPGFLAQVVTASPVHADQGLGFRLVTLPQGRRVLMLGSTGRRLFIAPHSRSVLLWVGQGMPPQGLENLLAGDVATENRQAIPQ